MSVFIDYSDYYDLLYSDKPYDKEVNYLYSLIKKHAPTGVNVLDLGCGTGRHDVLLSTKGFNVTGVDNSEMMIEIAQSQFPDNEFLVDDIRSIKFDRRFDIILSLFHVISYQTENSDLVSVFDNVSNHLEDNGIFIFDFWYGPAVLSEKPTVRIKEMENEKMKVFRVSEPLIHPNSNICDVNFKLLVTDKVSDTHKEIIEQHNMRYLFIPEIACFLKSAGLELICTEEWVTGNEPGLDTWGVCVVARKKPNTVGK
jgi:SAM-dependent methyltransferase